MSTPQHNASPAGLFSPLALRGVTLRNRLGVSPMCQYAAEDGLWNDWHLVHLGSRAVGGFGLIMTEATAVVPEGRITPRDAGLWSDAHVEPLARIARFVESHGAVMGVQLAHAGRKASTPHPWSDQPRGSIPLDAGGWQALGPSPLPFDDRFRTPREMTQSDLARVIEAFAQAAARALTAGVRLLEVHAAHGYLLHSFHSPLSNQRTDAYGGSHENRTRLTREAVRAVRRVWPSGLPLSVRLSCTDWMDGGWTLADSILLAAQLRDDGVDLIDCSSGGGYSGQSVKEMGQPLFQVPFAEAIRREAKVATAAVGIVTTPQEAQAIVNEGKADVVLLGRQALREPYFPMRALRELGEPGSPSVVAANPATTSFPANYAYWIKQG
jgi:2,4-dienoyl-CoA reductase-like NADH-dependent reductase (Old Yellow Enzyme family)